MVEGAVAEANIEAFEVLLQHIVDNACYCIGTVNRGRTVAQYFDALEPEDRQALCVDRVDRDKAATDGLGLVGGCINEASAVEQHQRVARAEVAEVISTDVAARRVYATADVLRFAEEVLALFGHELDEFVAGFDAQHFDIARVDDRNRQRVGYVGAPYLRSGDDDFLDVAFYIFVVLRQRQCRRGDKDAEDQRQEG